MAAARDNFRLGLTVIIMFALFVFCLLFIASKGLLQAETRDITIHLLTGPAMPEIVAGSKVTCFGQQVGKVTHTRIDEGDDPRQAGGTTQLLVITATVLEQLDLRADCRVAVTGPPLGGKGVLEIVDRGVAAEELGLDQPLLAAPVGLQAALASVASEFDRDDPTALLSLIRSQLDPAEKRSLLAKLHRSLNDVNRMTASLAFELDRSQDDILLDKLHEDLNRIGIVLEEVIDLVRDNRPKVDNTLAAVDHALQRIDNEIVSTLAEELNEEREGSLISQTHRAFERLNQSLNDVNAMTGEARQLVTVNSGRIDELVENATEASILLKRGVRDLAMHPWKLLSKPSESKQRELELIDAAREFAAAAAHLDDATSRLKALSDAEAAGLRYDDERLKKIQADLARSVEAYFEAEKALWTSLGAGK